METRSEVLDVSFAQDYHRLPAPLPYYPTLARALGGPTISIVFVYLEIHHPAPAPDLEATEGRKNPPVYVDCDAACEDLGVSRRTLHVALARLCAWWKSEEARSAAARSSREFFAPDHSRYGKIKPYSLVGSRYQLANQTFAIRRNLGKLRIILDNAGFQSTRKPNPVLSNTYTPESQVYASEGVTDTLPAILEKASKLGMRNGWTEERKRSQSEIMRSIWEIRKKS